MFNNWGMLKYSTSMIYFAVNSFLKMLIGMGKYFSILRKKIEAIKFYML